MEEFIGVKSYRARGKRISNYEVEGVEELEPTRFPEPEPESEEQLPMKVEIEEEENNDASLSDADLLDEITGQMKLFD